MTVDEKSPDILAKIDEVKPEEKKPDIDEMKLLSCRLKKSYREWVFGIGVFLGYLILSGSGILAALALPTISLLDSFGTVMLIVFDGFGDVAVMLAGIMSLEDMKTTNELYLGAPLVVISISLLYGKISLLCYGFGGLISLLVATGIYVTIVGYILLWCYCEIEKGYVRMGKMTIGT